MYVQPTPNPYQTPQAPPGYGMDPSMGYGGVGYPVDPYGHQQQMPPQQPPGYGYPPYGGAMPPPNLYGYYPQNYGAYPPPQQYGYGYPYGPGLGPYNHPQSPPGAVPGYPYGAPHPGYGYPPAPPSMTSAPSQYMMQHGQPQGQMQQTPPQQQGPRQTFERGDSAGSSFYGEIVPLNESTFNMQIPASVTNNGGAGQVSPNIITQ